MVKKVKEHKKKSLSQKILIYLKETSKDILDVSMTIIFDPHKVTKGMGLYTQDYPLRCFSKEISNLKRSPYFNFKNDKFYLTRKGRIKIIRRIAKEKRNKKVRWDKKWRVISFDIPEVNRKDRAFLRKELQWIGFLEVQKSVWIFPYNIEEELLTLLKLWKKDFRGDIRLWRIEKIVIDEDIKKHFHIS